jgi:hypothetical protein
VIGLAGRVAGLLLCATAALAGGCTRCDAGDARVEAAQSLARPRAGDGAGDSFRCTVVIGYSQVKEWYETGGAFERTVDDGAWQLLFEGGAGVDRWQEPGFVGWENPPRSPCASGSSAPDRALLSISGPFGADEERWAAAIATTALRIRQELPTVRRIVLQAVVGGPAHGDCFVDGGKVRASWQHAHIDVAIEAVVRTSHDGVGVVAGMSPEVLSCADYEDALGHLTEDGAAAAGRTIGAYYASEALTARPPNEVDRSR